MFVSMLGQILNAELAKAAEIGFLLCVLRELRV
jgi:hypothetical protein